MAGTKNNQNLDEDNIQNRMKIISRMQVASNFYHFQMTIRQKNKRCNGKLPTRNLSGYPHSTVHVV